MTTTDVDNWPADADGVQGPDLMARFQKHAERFDTTVIFDQIHTAMLDAKPHPTDTEIRQAMNSILCRCGTYYRVQDAIKRAIKLTASAKRGSANKGVA